MKNHSPLKGILVLIALLLALNLVVSLLRPAENLSPSMFPTAQASPILDAQRPFLYSVSEAGDTLYIWELGDYVGEEYESVRVTAFQAFEKPRAAK